MFIYLTFSQCHLLVVYSSCSSKWDNTLCETTKFISLLNQIESSVKAFWTANGAGRWKMLKFGWTEMDLNDFQSPRFSKNFDI